MHVPGPEQSVLEERVHDDRLRKESFGDDRVHEDRDRDEPAGFAEVDELKGGPLPSTFGAPVAGDQQAIGRILSSRQLDLIIALAKSRSLRSAANASGLSQSGMTRQLQMMESRLGVRLIARSHAGIRLTEAGERVLSLANVTQRMESELLFELSAARGDLRGHIKICGFSSVMRSVILPSITPLLARHRALTVHCDTEELYLVARKGACGQADIAITQVPMRIADFTTIELGHEYNVLVESAQHATNPNTVIDHEPSDRFTEYYLSVVGIPMPSPLRRVFLGDIYGLIAGAALGAGRAVVPMHLLSPADGVRVVAGTPAMRVPVVLNLRTQLLSFTAIRRVVDELRSRAPAFLARNALGVDVGPAVEGAFSGPTHLVEQP